MVAGVEIEFSDRPTKPLRDTSSLRQTMFRQSMTKSPGKLRAKKMPTRRWAKCLN